MFSGTVGCVVWCCCQTNHMHGLVTGHHSATSIQRVCASRKRFLPFENAVIMKACQKHTVMHILLDFVWFVKLAWYTELAYTPMTAFIYHR